MNETESWYSRGKAEADKGIPHKERVVGIALVSFNVFMILYFVAHQIRSTGFFTASFGTLEMFFLYGFWICGVISAGLEGVLGRRLLSRMFDAFGGLLFATIAIAWLFVVLPFEFAHFPDVLPESIRFLVEWITNDVARVIMVLGIIVHLGAAIFTPIAYKFVDIKGTKLGKILERNSSRSNTDLDNNKG